MSQSRVVAVSAGPSQDSNELARVVSCVLDGARQAGSETKHFILLSPHDATAVRNDTYGGLVTDPASIDSLVREAIAADHLVLGVAGTPRRPSSPIASFIDACYGSAEWLSLAGLVALENAGFSFDPQADSRTFKFPVSRRPLTDAHRGLVVLHPPREIPDHDDPFCESMFFVLEEVQRLLGFLPIGRILSTGLFDPPLDRNPILQRQALEIGRHLVSDIISAGAKK